MHRRTGILVTLVVAALAALPAQAYVVVLKDGSKLFGKDKYAVRNNFAVFTLENGNVAEVPMAKVDVDATEKYNKENVGNVLVLDTPNAKVLQTPKTTSTDRQNLSRYIQSHFNQPQTPREKGLANVLKVPPPSEIADPLIIREAIRILEGAGVTQYRLQIGPKVVLIADHEDAVFKGISAAARLAQDLTSMGKAQALDVEIVSSTGSDGGKFRMTPDTIKGLTEGSMTASEYFVQNVIF
jgi:hypothetical protein